MEASISQVPRLFVLELRRANYLKISMKCALPSCGSLNKGAPFFYFW
jgi:hypothetical protein